MNTQLYLDDFDLIELHIRSGLPGPFQFAATELASGPEIAFDYSVLQEDIEDEGFVLILRVTTEPAVEDDPLATHVDVTISGDFGYEEAPRDDQEWQVLCGRAASTLYDLLRGQVGLITGGFYSGRMALPDVDMPEIIRQLDLKKAEEPVPAKKPKPKGKKKRRN